MPAENVSGFRNQGVRRGHSMEFSRVSLLAKADSSVVAMDFSNEDNSGVAKQKEVHGSTP
jgi:hypothetical protein